MKIRIKNYDGQQEKHCLKKLQTKTKPRKNLKMDLSNHWKADLEKIQSSNEPLQSNLLFIVQQVAMEISQHLRIGYLDGIITFSFPYLGLTFTYHHGDDEDPNADLVLMYTLPSNLGDNTTSKLFKIVGPDCSSVTMEILKNISNSISKFAGKVCVDIFN